MEHVLLHNITNKLKMISSRLRSNIVFSSAVGLMIIWMIMGSDKKKLQNGITEKQPSILLQKAAGLPKSSMVIIEKFDSLYNKLEEQLEVVAR